MEIVILIFSDNTWCSCLILDIERRIAEHKWVNNIVQREVNIIFDWCSQKRTLENHEEWLARTDRYIDDIEKNLRKPLDFWYKI